jgi:hypothetical protein
VAKLHSILQENFIERKKGARKHQWEQGERDIKTENEPPPQKNGEGKFGT